MSQQLSLFSTRLVIISHATRNFSGNSTENVPHYVYKDQSTELILTAVVFNYFPRRASSFSVTFIGLLKCYVAAC